MRALVVVESMYGNTRQVADAVADGLATSLEASVVLVGDAPSELAPDLDLLVVGGPTHAHGMSNPDTRRSAAQRAASGLIPFRVGIREWLGNLASPPAGLVGAAFDTRIKGPALIWGSAAKDAEKELRRLGLPIVGDPGSFLVRGPLGPIHDVVVEGELVRARAWGEQIAAEIAARRPRSDGSGSA